MPVEIRSSAPNVSGRTDVLPSMKTLRLVLWLVSAGITASAQGQLVINELVASNSLLVDDPDFEQSSDVVELHNAGAAALDLSGWHLTDNFNDTTKWTFPDGVTIGAGDFLLVWCDGENAVVRG